MNKILYFLFIFIFSAFGFGFANITKVDAQTFPTFPAGCTSALGYSVTTGAPCNGTGTATMNIPGCTTALGYSIINGTPCSGTGVSIPYLAGCTSIYGYSTIANVPCNGTTVAQTSPTTTPGLPTTGDGGNALYNIVLLMGSGIIAFVGYRYFMRNKVVN